MDDKKYWKGAWKKSSTHIPNPFAKRAYVLMEKKNVKRVLDLGCGDGRDSLYFARQGITVEAFDFSESGIESLKKKNPSIKAHIGDIRNLPFKKNSFDAIYAHLSLHYFSDSETEKIFSKIHAMLKKDGLLFVKCKSTDDLLFGKGKKIAENTYRSGHVRHFFTKDYMAKQLNTFKVLRLKKSSSSYASSKSSFIEAIAQK
ncbi:MAG: class I SAM-dependent methyltransferase [Candidatus Pacebacteria bacterium]|nr:class I SAM-dependent methyltransferase [Candidatus Paceibacterota bacterium]MBP9832507.1 class I SAM-dependent methyltransferase [Candidatus Paceibacterota bacterium]